MKQPALQLTKREQQVLTRVLDGQESRQIAMELKISRSTVVNHRANLHRSMRTKNTAQLMREALRCKLWTP